MARGNNSDLIQMLLAAGATVGKPVNMAALLGQPAGTPAPVAGDTRKKRKAKASPLKPTTGRGTEASVFVPLPPSTNNLFLNVGKRRVQTPRYRAWIEEAYPLLDKLARPTRFPVAVLIVVAGKVNVLRDIANFEKAVTDGMVAQGVIPDDTIRYVNDNRQRYVGGDGEPTCEVFIFENQ